MAITKITGASIAADSIDGTKIADDAVNSEHLTDGGIDNAHIATGVDASKLTTGTLANARLPSNISDAGTEGTKVAVGTTAQRGTTTGQWRYNSTTGLFEGYNGTVFTSLAPTPTVTSVDDSEVDSAAGGNQTIVVTGTNFGSGGTITFIGSSAEFNAATTTYNSATQVTAVAPKSSFLNAQEPYKVKFTRAGGSAGTSASGLINVDNAPAWTTAAGTVATISEDDTGNHATLAATDAEGDTVSYAETGATNITGAGLALNSSTGVISGDPTDVSADTTVSFTVRATAGAKTSDRAFAIVVENQPILQTDLVFDFRAADFSGSAGTISDGTSLASCLGSRLGSAYATSEVQHGNVTFVTNDSYAPGGKAFNLTGAGALQVGMSSQANYNTYFNNPTDTTVVMWVDWNGSTREGFFSRYGTSAPADGSIYHFNHMFDSYTQLHRNSSGVNLGSGNESHGNWDPNHANDWTMWVITYDVSSGNQIWYVGNESNAMVTWYTRALGTNSGNGMTGYSNNQTPIMLGGRVDNVQMMNGNIAEARYYKRALTSAQITAEWNATKGNYSIS
jgi:hypothetical protein